MSASHTLNSRLRVLVAKTFRAEKLYTSIRNLRADKVASVATLSELANDIRAKEWQRSHYKLRVSLNDILALGSGAAAATEVTLLRERFLAKTKESKAALEAGSRAMQETVKRGEYAHTLRLSVEMIRHKARAQANQVIVDELSSLLDASGRTKGFADLSQISDELAEDIPGLDEAVEGSQDVEKTPPSRSNVISFGKRLVAGSRSGK
jgi:hypothetical protein